jgi:nucleolar protein 58
VPHILIITDSLLVALQDLDFSGTLEEEVEGQLKAASVVSMGTDISENDLDNIKELAQQVSKQHE